MFFKSSFTVVIFFAIAYGNSVPNYSEQCIHEWRPYTGNTDPSIYGIAAGFFKFNVVSYVGRGIFDNQYVPGRIQILEPTGLYHPSAWNIHRIVESAEYLVYNQSQTYEWINSKDGEVVENAVIPGFTRGRTMWYIARVKIGDFTYLGKVHGNWLNFNGGGNAHYESGDNKEVSITNYEVLTCRVNSCVCPCVCPSKKESFYS